MSVRRSIILLAIPFSVVAGATARASDCSVTSLGLPPLNDLGTGLYLDQFQGGLYPGGSNDMLPEHRSVGLARAAAMVPLNVAGQPDPAGRIVMLSIGMSNTTQEFCSQSSDPPCDPWTFSGRAALDARVNHDTLVIVNGARSGQVAAQWDSPLDANYDRIRDTRLAPLGLTEAQVQVVWVKCADPAPIVALPAPNADAYVFELIMGNVMRAIRQRYVNVKIAFLSSRIYAGYATINLNPEPFAYEEAFGVKWLIESQIAQMAGGNGNGLGGDLDYNTSAPWLAWGPYLWADGLTPRSDGLTWQCADFEQDGTHPSQSGEQKVGAMLLSFMATSPFTAPWFRACVPGDMTGDRVVDGQDISQFTRAMIDPGNVPPALRCPADVNGDGLVDARDVAPFVEVLLGV